MNASLDTPRPACAPGRAAASGGLGRGPAAWMLALLAVAVAGLSDLALRADEATAVDLVSAGKLALWLGGLVLLAWAGRPALASLGTARARPILGLALFFAWGLLTSPLSLTPTYTAAAALGGLGIVALALLMAQRLPVGQALLVWTLALALPVAASLLRSLVDPAAALAPMDGGAQWRLAGWFGSPNNLGRSAALLLLVAALAARHLPPARAAALLAVVAALGLPALLMSESRGALLALAAAVAWWMLAPRLGWALVVAALAACAVLSLMAMPWLADDLALAFSRSGRLEEMVSLTGRTEIWSASLALIGQEPWLGHGFASSRDLLPAAWQGDHGWTTTSAHNLWLQAALGGGAVGLALLVAGQLVWLRDALARPLAEADTVVVFVLVLGLLEASATGPSINTMSLALAWGLAMGLRRG